MKTVKDAKGTSYLPIGLLEKLAVTSSWQYRIESGIVGRSGNRTDTENLTLRHIYIHREMLMLLTTAP